MICVKFWCAIHDTCLYRDSAVCNTEIPYCNVKQKCDICSWRRECKDKEREDKNYE